MELYLTSLTIIDNSIKFFISGFYLAGMFAVAPIFVFLLSLAGTTVMYAVLGPLLILFFLLAIINVIQTKRSHWLPHFIRDWSFLPLWMRSFQPLDNFFSRLACCTKCMGAETGTGSDLQDQLEHGIAVYNPENNAEEMQVLVDDNSKTPQISRQDA